MLTLLIGIAVAGSAQAPENGYLDYLAAAKIMQSAAVQKLGDAASKPGAGLVERRALSEATGKARLLVQLGNSRPLLPPHSFDRMDELFPELASFRSLARMMCAHATVQFADGKPDQGTDTLLSALEFSQRISVGPLIFELVSVASTSVVLAEFERQMPRLSYAACKRVQSYLTERLAKPPGIVDAMQKEAEYARAALEEFAKDPKAWSAAYEDESPETKRLRDLSNTEAAAIAKEASVLLDEHFCKILDILSGPESHWHLLDEEIPAEPNDLPAILALNTMPVFSQAAIVAQRSRTQLRLLRAHAAIQQYAIDRLKLPTKPEELPDPSVMSDPLTGEYFEFLSTGDGYELRSTGNEKTGVIHLKMRRLASREDQIEPNGP